MRKALLAILSLLPALAPPCCSPGHPGKAVKFGDQTNIIIWNPQTGTEHFIRKALFKSNSSDFGFIAPTPTKPEIAEASEKAFSMLANLAPRPASFGCAGPISGAKSAPVRVLQEMDVAGYHATTLFASDSKDLATWMTKNGYQSTPGIEAWTKPYIQKGWLLTAFKVLNDGPEASTGTVRLTFKTDKPFNPFFVPEDNISPSAHGTLRVFFVSNAPYDGRIGGTEYWQDAVWQSDLPERTAGDLAAQLKLPLSAIPTNAQVQMFEDRFFPRAASDDIYFTPSIPRLQYVLVSAATVILVLAFLRFRVRRHRPSPGLKV